MIRCKTLRPHGLRARSSARELFQQPLRRLYITHTPPVSPVHTVRSSPLGIALWRPPATPPFESANPGSSAGHFRAPRKSVGCGPARRKTPVSTPMPVKPIAHAQRGQPRCVNYFPGEIWAPCQFFRQRPLGRFRRLVSYFPKSGGSKFLIDADSRRGGVLDSSDAPGGVELESSQQREAPRGATPSMGQHARALPRNPGRRQQGMVAGV